MNRSRLLSVCLLVSVLALLAGGIALLHRGEALAASLAPTPPPGAVLQVVSPSPSASPSACPSASPSASPSPTPSPSASPSLGPCSSPSPTPCGSPGALANFPAELNRVYTGGGSPGNCGTSVGPYTPIASDPLIVNGVLTIPSGSTTQMAASVTIPNGVTLAIQSGTTVKVAPSSSLFVQSGGVFNTSGTADAKGAVVLTSANASTAPGDWGGVFFQEGSSGTLDHMQISFAGARTAIGFCGSCYTSAGIIVRGAQPTISNATIDHNTGNGIEVVNGNLSLSSDTFTANSGWAVLFDAVPANFSIGSNLSGSGNGHDRIGMVSEGTVTGTWNLAASQGLPLELDGNLSVGAGGMLTLGPGATILMNGNSIIVNPASGSSPAGIFNASGTQAQAVTLTSANASPAPGDWGAVFFQSGSSGILDHVQISFAGKSTFYGVCGYCHTSAAIIVDGAQPAISNSTIDHNNGNGIEVRSGNLSLSGDTFTANSGWAVVFAAVPANFSIGSNLSGSGNGHDRIGMVSEGTVTGTWNLAASQGLPLEIDATLHVGAGGSLNLLAGAMLYMGGTSIYVEPAANGAPAGVFNASGTQPQPVTLTSAKASPSPGDWGAVVFQSGSSGTLDHVQLSYAGARTAYTFVNGGSTSAGIIVNGAQPTITHSVLDRIYGYDVIAVGGGLPILHNDRFGLTLSGFNGVQNSGWQPGQPPIDATNNDWGAADGPSGIGLGSGVAVSQGVYYDPWISSSIATLSGTVFGISSAPQNVLPGAAVQVCRSNRTSCRTVMTDANGVYSLSVMPPGQYLLEVNPPAGKTLISQPAKATVTTPGQTVTQDIILSALTPPPPGSTRGEIGFTSDGYPVFVMGHPIIICFPTCPPAPGPVQANPAFQTVVPSAYVGGKGGCEGGTAEIPILKFADGKELYHVGVPEDQANKGFYKTDLGNVADHGGAAGDGVIHCPDGSTYTYPFGLYNDPSGTVKDTQGRPVIGATVTLLHSDSPTGSYIPVPDGSAIMSPSNRRNPDITNNDGLFHWDVLAGFYKVQASKTGCPNTGFASYNGADPLYQGGAVLPVPPPVVDLVITLDCPSNTPGPNVTAVLPFTGPSRGGTTITLSGSNFQSGATVTIGGQPATGVSVSPDGTRVTFTTPAIGVIGDVNGDGHVDAVDALCVLRDVAGLAETAACPASALNKSVAVNVSNPDGRTATPNGSFIFNTEDFNGDLKVDAVDALCILRSVAGLTPTQACPSLSGTGQAAAVGPQPLALPSSRSR